MSKDSETPIAGSESRRSFLTKLGLGAAALALFTAPFFRFGRSTSERDSGVPDEFPGEDSIFHPAQDPRLDPRRNDRS